MVLPAILLVVGIVLLLIGVGFSLRWISWMIRGVGHTPVTLLIHVIVGALGIAIGIWLIVVNAPPLGIPL